MKPDRWNMGTSVKWLKGWSISFGATSGMTFWPSMYIFMAVK